MSNKTSQHILPTAASIVSVLLCVSVILSFISIKSDSKIWTHRLESIAEIFFGIAITGIGIIVLVLLRKFWLQ